MSPSSQEEITLLNIKTVLNVIFWLKNMEVIIKLYRIGNINHTEITFDIWDTKYKSEIYDLNKKYIWTLLTDVIIMRLLNPKMNY